MYFLFESNEMINFLKYRYVCFAVSSIFLLSGVAAYFYHGGLQYSVDFTGGTQVLLKCDKSVGSEQIKNALPSIKIVQVIHVLNEASIEAALTISEQVDAILLDSGNPNLKTKELGGTGRVHNWSLSKKIVAQSKRPVYLAGGIHPLNIKQAIEEVQPYGIDLCSGVRTNQLLDPVKLELLFNAIH